MGSSMVFLAVAFALAFLAVGPAWAEPPRPSAQATDDAFLVQAALMNMTRDEFAAIWQTPEDVRPRLTVSPQVEAGSPVVVALFGLGMQHESGKAAVDCRVWIVFPDGTTQMAAEGRCRSLPAAVKSGLVYLLFAMDFAPPESLAGHRLELRFEVLDTLGNRAVELGVSADVVAREGPSK